LQNRRWGGKAHWADRVRSNRWQGFLCEGASCRAPIRFSTYHVGELPQSLCQNPA
jgi:hypothetical protein